MGWKRYAGHRPDANAADIIEDLRRVGALVWPIGRPCDLLVLHGDRYYLLDVDGITKNRKRDPEQLETFRDFRVRLVKTREDAFAAIGLRVDA
jgi:hypothetical protein